MGNSRYTRSVSHEISLIAAFVKRNKRDRYREIISDSRLRHKFTGRLAHFKDFDARYRLPFPSNRLFVDNIARELDKRHSPKIVFAISEDPALDQKEVPLAQALEKIVGHGLGTILSCIPGRLAFVETEEERFILERNDPLEKREFIRFVVGHKDEDSGVEQGIFQAVSRAIEWEIITGADADELIALRAWFSENLEKPTSFGRGKLSLGICWFKLAASEHVAHIWRMVRILERHGIYVKKIKTEKPGYLVYEDDWQVVAEPFRKGTLPRK
ncbi:MAG TPA: hypothetical protein VND90_08385 [Terracidiphilus sp.]|nr:hypothetical protein [Terracidiphilus sp.]